MHVCIHIDTRVGPLGLPARTGVLIAHAPPDSAPAGPCYMRDVFAAGVSSHGRAVEVGDNLLIGATCFGGQGDLPGDKAERVADALQVGRAH